MKDLEKDFKCLLLSYPRSGSNWLRYCLEFLTKKPSVGPEHKKIKLNQPFGSRLGLGVDLKSNYILYRAHEIDSPVDKPLIVLLRNYKECILRHSCLSANPEEVKRAVRGEKGGRAYMNLLEVFGSWEKPKLIVYYEDLLTNPRVELEKILLFLKEAPDHLDEFALNYDKHKRQSVGQYSTLLEKSQTGGKLEKLKFHSSKLKCKDLKNIDDIMRDFNTTLFDQSLSRYREF